MSGPTGGPDVSRHGDTRRIRREGWVDGDLITIVSAGSDYAILEAETLPESTIRSVIYSDWVIKAINPFGGSWVRFRVELENHAGPDGQIREGGSR